MNIVNLSDYNKTVAIHEIMRVEGGSAFTDIKQDSGGKTRFGVTEATANEFKHLWKKHNFDGDMRKLPYELAFEIYETGWWKRMCLDDILLIHPLLCQQVLDFAVNAGRSLGAKSLQRIINVLNLEGKLYPDLNVDGLLGPKSVASLQALVRARGNDVVFNVIFMLQSIQNVHYITLAEAKPSQETFSLGWSNRVKETIVNVTRFLINR